jgi:hypothetical protein
MRGGKMGFPKSQVGSSPTLIAKLQVSREKGKVKITYFDTSESVILPLENCPSNICSGEKMMVKLSGDGKRMFSVYPADGMFKLTCTRLSHKDGEEPAPRTQEGKWGTYQSFIAITEIVDGDYKGMTIPYFLRYNFGEFFQDGKSIVGITKMGSKSIHSPKLEEFLMVTGANMNSSGVDAPITYKDNVLPAIEKRIQAHKKVFTGVLKDGWILTLYGDSYTPVEDDED